MKKLISLFFVASLFLIGFTACEQQGEEPGIPGMGDTPGELEIAETFTAPEGVIINLETLDEANIENALSSQNQLKSTEGFFFRRGCGGSQWNGNFKVWIRVKLDVQNTSNQKWCFNIPAGTVFQVSDPSYQNGITISPIKICVESKGFCNVELWLMCLNRGKDGSTANVTYKILGVTGNARMWNLVRKLRYKRCNIEWYLNVDPSAKLKSATAENIETYKELADQIQNAIWQLTNDGEDLTEEQIKYFESLPDIE